MAVTTSLITLVILFILGYVLGSSVKSGLKTAMIFIAFIGFLALAGIISIEILKEVFGIFHSIEKTAYKEIFLSSFGSSKEEIGLNLSVLFIGFLWGFKK